MNLSTSDMSKKKKMASEEPEAIIENAHVLQEAQDSGEDLSELSFNEKIVYWKAKYKRIFKTEIDKEDYIWRRITRREYTDIALNKIDADNSKIDIYEKQYLFCKAAVLYPENIEEVMNECAGIAPTLADEIIFKSGFGEIYPKTEEVGVDDNETDEG